METLKWGLLGPGALSVERRTRTLGLGSTIRSFNDLAVPGLGGVWFGKQIFLATLGVAVAEKARATGKHFQNIETTNAIEALACFLAFSNNDWKSDHRLLGVSKMQRHNANNLTFSRLRNPSFYVTQPMRMATVQTLPSLGLVNSDSSRFNAFSISQAGLDIIEAQSNKHNPCYYNKSILEYLLSWVCGESEAISVSAKEKLREVLSPLEPMTDGACFILEERLIQGGVNEILADKDRRRNALQWIELLRKSTKKKISWEDKPDNITTIHWHDLYAGSLLFRTRDAAIRVLDKLEIHINNNPKLQFTLNDLIPEPIEEEIQTLRICAQNFLNQNHADILANIFCRECVEANDNILLVNLVRRDKRVLCLRGQVITPGIAFQSSSSHPNSDTTVIDGNETMNSAKAIEWPEGISRRINKLFLLNKDLHGELSTWLAQKNDSNIQQELFHE